MNVAFAAIGKSSSPSTIAVIGTGYVGLTAGACMALLGHQVICADADVDRVTALRSGEVPIVEEGLPELVRSMVAAGRLRFTADNFEAIGDAAFVFLCLPTPQDDDGSADLSRVIGVARQVGPRLRVGTCVVNKSTVPVGTSRLVLAALGRDDLPVVSNPEFLAEGSAVRDFLRPDRLVVGSDVQAAAQAVADLYDGVESQVLLTDAASAETIKYAANAYLAIRLTFVNSMAAICEASGADIRAVTAGIGADTRIGTAFLRPGPGWGGSCFPKDTAALVRTAHEHGFEFDLLQAAVDANAWHRRWLLGKLVTAAGGDVRGKRVALWGLTFKSGTDDLRDSPALEIAQELVQLGADVRVYDPTVTGQMPGMQVAGSPTEAVVGAEVLFIGTEWPIFASQSLTDLAELMNSPVVVDGRNVLDPTSAKRAGLVYHGLGFREGAALHAADPRQQSTQRMDTQRVR